MGEQIYNTCLRCKRPLRSERSQISGYGPVCAKKAAEEFNLITLLSPDNHKAEEQNFVDELKEMKVGSA